MKKLTLLLMLALTVSFAKAQFELTPSGFVDKNNKDKDYIVLEVAGKSKADLYKTTLIYLKSLYQRDNVLSLVDGESINISALDNETIATVSNNYSFNLEFKDGKIKVKPSAFLYYFSSVDGRKEDYEIYSNNGRLKRSKDKERLEYFYNGYAAILKKNAEKKSEDW